MKTCPNGHPADGDICVSYKCERLLAESWVQFTKRTEDPKLTWLEAELSKANIPHRRQGQSWHAPILQVPQRCLNLAWAILEPVDDLDDNHEAFQGDALPIDWTKAYLPMWDEE